MDDLGIFKAPLHTLPIDPRIRITINDWSLEKGSMKKELIEQLDFDEKNENTSTD